MGLLDRILGRRAREGALVADALSRGRAALASKDLPAALAAAHEGLLRAPGSGALLRLAADALQGHDATIAESFARAADAPDDVERILELGSRLLTSEEPQLACAFLQRALTFAPFDAVIRSELAIAQARSGRPGDAVQTLALHPCLVDDPGALFEFGWASLLTFDLEAAEGALDALEAHPGASDLRRKLSYALPRAHLLADAPRDARCFLFVEHGSLLLWQADRDGGRFGSLDLGADLVARVVGEAAATLPRLIPRPRRVIAATERATALADALASAIDGERVDRWEGAGPGVLEVALDAAQLEERERGAVHARPPSLRFALVLDHSRTCARTPDFVGLCARAARLDPAALRDAAALRATPDVGPAAEGLVAFVERGRAHLPPAARRVASAYVPDAPLPWP